MSRESPRQHLRPRDAGAELPNRTMSKQLPAVLRLNCGARHPAPTAKGVATIARVSQIATHSLAWVWRGSVPATRSAVEQARDPLGHATGLLLAFDLDRALVGEVNGVALELDRGQLAAHAELGIDLHRG